MGGAVVLFAARRQLELALLGVLALVAFVPAAGEAAPPYAPVPTCAPGPADCSAWHTGDVSVSWQYEPGWTAINCNSLPVLTDTSGVDRTCSVSYGPTEPIRTPARSTVKSRRHATSDHRRNSVTCPRLQWLVQPFAVGGVLRYDATSGIASCTTPSYGAGDGASVLRRWLVQRCGGQLEQRKLRLQVRRDSTCGHAIADRPPDRRAGTESRSPSASPAPTSRPGSLPARRRPSTRAPTWPRHRLSARAATRPETSPRRARRSSTTRRRRPSPSPRPWSRRASRRSSGSVRRTLCSSSSSARRGSTGGRRPLSTEATV